MRPPRWEVDARCTQSRQFTKNHATGGQNYQAVTTPASPGHAHTPIRPRNSTVGAVLSYPSFYEPFCALAPNSRRLRLSSGRNSASSRSPALVLGCPFLSFSSTFRSRHQSLYLSSMVGYSNNPEIQICKSAKDTRGATLILSKTPIRSAAMPRISLARSELI